MPEPVRRPPFHQVETTARSQRRRALAELRGIYVPPDLRKFEHRLADLLPRVMEKSGATARVEHTRIADDWRAIVGEFIHKHSRPVALRRGTLIVAVTQAAVRYDLERNHRAGILARLQTAYGAATVKAVKFQNG